MNLWVHGRENENSSGFLPYNFEHLPYNHMHTTLSTVQSAICRCPKPFGNVELSPDFIWFPGIRCACLFKESCTILQEVQLMYVTSDIIERNRNGWEQNQELTAQFSPWISNVFILYNDFFPIPTLLTIYFFTR